MKEEICQGLRRSLVDLAGILLAGAEGDVESRWRTPGWNRCFRGSLG